MPKDRAVKRRDARESSYDLTRAEEGIKFHVEEAIVHLHALCHYYEDALSQTEFHFLKQAKKNLAIIHRKHGSA